MVSWFVMLKEAMERDGENFERRICTLDEEALKKEWNMAWCEPQGQAFTAWGERWVYFPLCYDGSEWVGHAPRNPCEIAMQHQGG